MTVNYCLRRAKYFFGDNVAIEHGDQKLTYREMYAEVERSARKLVSLGARSGRPRRDPDAQLARRISTCTIRPPWRTR